MCDTLVALNNATADGSVIFAKNSDREPNEVHEVVLVPATEHASGNEVKCTYISIPQVRQTHAVLLAKPFWIWGAEMGANEHGVAIGNEAVFTRMGYDKTPGLIGMDFLRLALERATTADTALEVITSLLEQYGQGGNCGLSHPLFYCNSFLIADRKSAWVLETAGKHWAAIRVKDTRTISNYYTIEHEWDLASGNLVDYAYRQGYCRKGEEFSFRRCYSDLIYSTFADGSRRHACTEAMLREHRGRIDTGTMMNALRTHRQENPTWNPGKGLMGADVCMHAGFGPIRVSQSVGSMVARLSGEGDTFWITGSSAPCLSVFFPVWMESGLPTMGKTDNATYTADSFWWRHERFHRLALRDFPKIYAWFSGEQQKLEDQFRIQEMMVRKESSIIKRDYTVSCFSTIEEMVERGLEQVKGLKKRGYQPFYAHLAWKGFDKAAQIQF